MCIEIIAVRHKLSLGELGSKEKTIEYRFLRSETAQSRECAKPSKRRRRQTTMRRWRARRDERRKECSSVLLPNNKDPTEVRSLKFHKEIIISWRTEEHDERP